VIQDAQHNTLLWAMQDRTRRLAALRANPADFPAIWAYYKTHPAEWISHWIWTHDPRLAARNLPSIIPFCLWKTQVDCVNWIVDRWRAGEPGLIEKSRDSGVTWLTVAIACWMCIFHTGIVVGFGSRKLEYVDQIGSMKSIFEKIRFAMSNLPVEFIGDWNRDRHALYTRILFPATGSIITGEGGDSIGRGDRTSIHFIDEAAFLERPEMIDASLSQTTNCRIDVSTPNGLANSFAQRRFGGNIKVFSFHWRDDPRKDDAWYQKQVAELDPVTVASEIDIDYRGSVEGLLIPSAWIQAAIGAHLKLGITPSGTKRAAFDVADSGVDLCAFAGRHGILLQHLESWSGRSGDIYASLVRVFDRCDEHGYPYVLYDADGLGAGCRGDARIINERREADDRPRIHDEPFRGSASPVYPERELVEKRKNKDFFANLKAQGWWALRLRFQETHRAINGLPYDADNLISISPDLPELNALTMELSQPTYSLNSAGKVLIDKAPDGMRSPNLADATMIAFAPVHIAAELWAQMAD